MNKKIPCGGYLYDDSSIEFTRENGQPVMIIKGGSGSGGDYLPLDGSKPMMGTLQTFKIASIDNMALQINSEKGTIFSCDNAQGIPEPIMMLDCNETNIYIPINMDNNPITNVQAPSSANDAATKKYVDEAIMSINGGSGGSGGNYFSTEETQIGTWIDGRPLYRMVIICNTPSKSNSPIEVAQVDGGKHVVNIYGTFVYGPEQYFPINTVPIQLQTYYRHGSIVMGADDDALNKVAYVIIEYYKDVANLIEG